MMLLVVVIFEKISILPGDSSLFSGSGILCPRDEVVVDVVPRAVVFCCLRRAIGQSVDSHHHRLLNAAVNDGQNALALGDAAALSAPLKQKAIVSFLILK